MNLPTFHSPFFTPICAFLSAQVQREQAGTESRKQESLLQNQVNGVRASLRNLVARTEKADAELLQQNKLMYFQKKRKKEKKEKKKKGKTRSSSGSTNSCTFKEKKEGVVVKILCVREKNVCL